MTASRFQVDLAYSLDHVHYGEEQKHLQRLYDGGDYVTHVLNYFQVPYFIHLECDFWCQEPVLKGLKKINEDGDATSCLYSSEGRLDGSMLGLMFHKFVYHGMLPENWRELYEQKNVAR